MIENASVLDGLPSRTIIHDYYGDVWERHGHIETRDGRYSAWLGVFHGIRDSTDIALPARLVYTPSEEDIDDTLIEVAYDAAFPGLPQCMSKEEALRRIRAALVAVGVIQ